MIAQHKDPVSKKITELYDVLIKLEDDLKVECAEASLCGNFKNVSSIANTCTSLNIFKKDVKNWKNQWSIGSSEIIDKKVKQNLNAKISKKSRLQVSIGSKHFNEQTASGTFVAVLEFLGLEKVSALNLQLCKHPLVSRVKTTSYQNQKQCGNWYIVTHASTNTMKQQLDKIADKLKIVLVAKVLG